MPKRSYGADVIMVQRGPYRALYPVDGRAEEAIGKVPLGEHFGIRIVRDRSLPQHNLFWSVLDHVGRATKFENAERLLVALKIRLGRYDLMKMPNGRVVPVPHSISFGAMTRDEFQKFKAEAMAVICDELLGGYNPDDLIREVQSNHIPHPPPADRPEGSALPPRSVDPPPPSGRLP